jgi:AcrR family transcriptional regulator
MDHNSSAVTAPALPDARIVRTRSALRDALLTLLEERAFDDVTVRDLSARAGIGYATFFRHYPSKAALLDDVAADEIRELLELSIPDVRATDSRAAAMAMCRHVDERRALWAVLLTGGAAGRMREEFIRQARANVPEVVHNNSWLPDDLKVIFGVAGAVEILSWWLYRGHEWTVEQAAEIVDRLVVAPMVRAP